MANWYGAARSNYFLVKDRAAFNTWAKARNLEVLEEGPMVGIHPDGAEGWPSFYWDETEDDDVDFDIPKELSELLVEGQVVVMLETGAEKLRYITGRAVAFDHTGKVVELSLSEIYDRAKQEFGVEPTAAEY